MAGIAITNEAQLLNMFQSVAKEVIRESSNRILDMLIKYIYKYTYEYGGDNVEYYDGSGTPTYEFVESWFVNKMTGTANRVASQVMQDWMSMSYDPDTYLHGSKYTGDVRKELADILNVDGVSAGDFSGYENSKVRRAYFDILLKDLNDGEMIKIFDEEFAKFGFRRGIIII